MQHNIKQWKKEAGHSEKFTIPSHLTRWTNTIYSPRIARDEIQQRATKSSENDRRKKYLCHVIWTVACARSRPMRRKRCSVSSQVVAYDSHTRCEWPQRQKKNNAEAAKRRNENVENILNSFFPCDTFITVVPMKWVKMLWAEKEIKLKIDSRQQTHIL